MAYVGMYAGPGPVPLNRPQYEIKERRVGATIYASRRLGLSEGDHQHNRIRSTRYVS